jgi:hypothetical protein
VQRQLLTLSGLASVVMVVLAFGVSGESPGTGESAATVKAFYVDHSSDQRLGGFFAMIAAPLLIFFAVALREALIDSRGDGESRLWANVALAGSAVTASGLLLAAVLQFALAGAGDDLGGSALQALNALSSDTWPAYTGGLGVLLLGSAGAMIPLRTGMRWFGWVALVLGVLIYTPLGFAGFAGAGLWIVLVSVALTMRTRSAPARALAA